MQEDEEEIPEDFALWVKENVPFKKIGLQDSHLTI